MFMCGKRSNRTGRVGARAILLLLCLSLCCCLSCRSAPGRVSSHAVPQGAGAVLSGGQALTNLLPPPGEGTHTSAKAHILLEASSDAVLAQKNADARLPMASTTKIMTALAALDALPLDTTVRIPAAAVGVEGSSVYLAQDETLTLKELLYALLLESANDAAVAIAIAVDGSVDAFADRMNRYAAQLGLKDTHFVNPHGLDDDAHYTTARELALITRAALENPDFREIVSTQKTVIPLRGSEGVRLLLNHNRLLREYDGCIGVKTGFTKKTGRCLVSAAERDGVMLIAVTLGAPDDWNDHSSLLDYGFSRLEAVKLTADGADATPMWIVSGTRAYTLVRCPDSLTVVLPRERGTIRRVTELPRFDFAPVAEGQTLGRLVWYLDTEGGSVCIGQVPLTALYSVEETPRRESLLERLRKIFRQV